MVIQMEKSRVLKILYRWNPWWTGEMPPIPEFKRDDFYNLLQETKEKKITAVVGPRQTGKTTIMYQMIDHLIKKEDRKRILYLPMDDVVNEFSKEISVREILEIYSLEVLREPFSKGKKFVFLDEIQYHKKWSNELKTIFDLKYDIKFFISGSSSTDILKGSSESLVGRISTSIILPMRFVEAVKSKIPEWRERIDKNSIELRESLKKSIETNDLEIFYRKCKSIYNKIIPIEEQLKIMLKNYFELGGYPEIVISNIDRYKSLSMLRNYITLVFHKDFVNFFGIRDAKSMERIFGTIAKNTSGILSERNIASDMGISINTTRNYLRFLEDTFLINRAKIYSKSYAKQVRRAEKYYVTDTGIGNSIAFYEERDMEKVAETVVHNHTMNLSYYFSLNRDVCYWREKYEVDIVLKIHDKIIPIEVKYGKPGEIKGMDNLLARYPSPFGVVVSEELKMQDGKVFVPIYLFLLM